MKKIIMIIAVMLLIKAAGFAINEKNSEKYTIESEKITISVKKCTENIEKCTEILKKEPEYVEPVPILTTAYCDGEVTCTGKKVRYGICAVKKEWIGKTALIYNREEDGTIGDLLGIYECLDTGFGADSDGDGIGSIQEGKVVDVYFPTLEECEEWMKKTNRKVYIQLFDAEG